MIPRLSSSSSTSNAPERRNGWLESTLAGAVRPMSSSLMRVMTYWLFAQAGR